MTTVLRILFFTFLGWIVILALMVSRAHPAVPTIEQSLAFVQAGLPNCNHIGIVWMTDAEADAQLWAGPYGADGVTVVEWFPCDVAIRRSLTENPSRLCDTIIHEGRHLMGQSHTDKGVWTTGPKGDKFPPCHPRATPKTTRRVHKMKRHHVKA